MTTEYGIIVGYVLFVGFLMILSTNAGTTLLANYPTAPTFPAAATSWDYLIFPVVNLTYMFSMMALTAVAYPILGVLLLGYSVVFLYIVMGLIRGGH